MRTTNVEMLKNWLNERRVKNSSYRKEFAKKVRISESLLNKILYSKHTPDKHVRYIMSHKTGIDEDVLFPIIPNEGVA